jgi:hypothetical protein
MLVAHYPHVYNVEDNLVNQHNMANICWAPLYGLPTQYALADLVGSGSGVLFPSTVLILALA